MAEPRTLAMEWDLFVRPMIPPPDEMALHHMRSLFMSGAVAYHRLIAIGAEVGEDPDSFIARIERELEDYANEILLRYVPAEGEA